MIKFILPIAAFIAAIYGISISGLTRVQKKKIDSFKLNNSLIGGISLTIYLIFD